MKNSFSINNTANLFKIKTFTNLSLVFVVCCFLGCRKKVDFYSLPAMATEHSVNAVIEIPAGINKKFEYDNISKSFVVDIENGQERIIDFLPYPGNYGFIPSTVAKSEMGGDGDALDILVISQSLPTATVIESIPIALLKLIDDGEMDYKIIAVPKEKSLRIIQATTYNELMEKYNTLPKIIELWFLNYNQTDISTVKGWGNENEALQEIKRHLKK